MIKLKIDNIEVKVNEETSVLKAAESIGIEIPAMCFMEGYSNHPSCMICIVKNKISGELFPSCAIPVSEGMEIITRDPEIKEARRDALELLLSDHVGDCEAPCRYGCPAFMNIPLMNRLIAENKFDRALEVVKEEIALPLILGYICEAPCEKVCRRSPIDNPVSICQLKKFVATKDLEKEKPHFPSKEKSSGKKVAIIGAGPTGLACAFHLTEKGHQTVLFDKNSNAGGTLRNLSTDLLPKEVLEKEIEFIKNYGTELKMNKQISGTDISNLMKDEFDAVVLATGSLSFINVEETGLRLNNTGLEIKKDIFESNVAGIFACGSVLKKQKMAIKAVAQGKECAGAVHLFLQVKPLIKEHRMFNSKFGKLNPDEFDEYLLESIPDDRLIPDYGMLQGFNHKEAVMEATRCMHCDCRKPDTCKLRIFADEYQADRRKYLSGDRKQIKKYFNHETIVYEPEKCIKCGLCVEITKNEKELTGLSFVGRGFNVKVSVPFNEPLNKALTKTALKCAEACPTGAISIKNEIKNHE